METDGTINNYVKQEQSVIRREAARLFKYFDGIRAMDKYPRPCLSWTSNANITQSPRRAG